MKLSAKKVILTLGVAFGLSSASIQAQPADCNVCVDRMWECEDRGDFTSPYCTVWLNACFGACVPER